MYEDWSIYNDALVDEAMYFFFNDPLESFKKLDVKSKGEGQKAFISKQPDNPTGSYKGILQASIRVDGGDGKDVAWQAWNKGS